MPLVFWVNVPVPSRAVGVRRFWHGRRKGWGRQRETAEGTVGGRGKQQREKSGWESRKFGCFIPFPESPASGSLARYFDVLTLRSVCLCPRPCVAVCVKAWDNEGEKDIVKN